MAKPNVLITISEPRTDAIQLPSHSDLIINHKEHLLEDINDVQAKRVECEVCNALLDGGVLVATESKLRTVSTKSTGIDGVVADTAVGLMLAAARRFYEGRLKMENIEWTEVRSPQWMLGQDVVGATVGIVGLSGVGQTIVKRLEGFEVGRILYTGRSFKSEGQKLGAIFVSFKTLLSESDYVIVACPKFNETNSIFDEAAFAMMKPTSVFVDVANSGIVVYDALLHALRNRVIFAAGLEVMDLLPSEHALMQMPNCIIVPRLVTARTKMVNDP